MLKARYPNNPALSRRRSVGYCRRERQACRRYATTTTLRKKKIFLRFSIRFFKDLTTSTLLHLGRVQTSLTLHSTSAAPSAEGRPPKKNLLPHTSSQLSIPRHCCSFWDVVFEKSRTFVSNFKREKRVAPRP